MKAKHNKKRNTAFLYESLIKEITRNIISENNERKKKAIGIVKDYFSDGMSLKKELDLYRSLYESNNLERLTCEKIMKEVKAQHTALNIQEVFKLQSKLINDINKQLSPSVYSNFIPNYKTIASIAQIFNSKSNVKKTIILENEIIDYMSGDFLKENKELKPIDNLALNTFVKKFNQKYSEELLNEQKELLNFYITSFMDNGINLKMFLNEEIGRLKKELNKSLKLEDVSTDSGMSNKVNKIVSNLDLLSDIKINENMIRQILKVQNLVKEINE